MQPWMGGMVDSQCFKAAARDTLDVTSHLSATTFVWYFASSSATSCDVASEVAPERESKTMCVAPFAASQLAVLLPIPPVPPAIRYVALELNLQVLASHICF
jgi:hypothetical protein